MKYIVLLVACFLHGIAGNGKPTYPLQEKKTIILKNKIILKIHQKYQKIGKISHNQPQTTFDQPQTSLIPTHKYP
jgi:hypothetical protein